MPDKVTTAATTLAADDVIARAVQFFSGENWRPTSQSPRTATFQGMPPIPWFYLLATFAGFLFCLLPGIIMYVMVIRKMRRFQNLVVTVNSAASGTEVVIQCPEFAVKLAARFIDALPGIVPTAVP